jgi:hypothetical protein
MKVLLPVLLLAAAVAAVMAGPAGAGGDAGPPVYPAVVNVQLVRAEALLAKATLYEDKGEMDKAVLALTATRSHLRKAWLGAKYVIDNAPPPVAGDASVPTVTNVPAQRVAKAKAGVKPKSVAKQRAKARISGGAVPGASPFADQFTTALGVLALQYDVATMAMGMLDTASGTLLNSVSTTLFAALTARDTAIAYIHSVDVPVAASGGIPAHSSGGAIVGSWASVMPGVTPYIDDELHQLAGIRATVKLSSGRKTILNAVEVQDVATENTINRYWPPVVGD